MASLRELQFPSPAVATRGSDKYPELSRQPLVSPCPPGTQSDSLGCPVDGLAQPGLWMNERCPDEGLSLHKTPISGELERGTARGCFE